MKTLSLLAAAALAMAASLPAYAHTPYLVPSSFAPRAGQTIAVDASFAETFFVPETAFDDTFTELTRRVGDLADRLHIS